MARRGPEGKIQDAVIKYAREKYDALCKKNEKGMYGSVGFLDFSVYPYNRRNFTIEFKAPGEGLTPVQQNVWDGLTKRGHVCYKIDSIAYGKLIIDKECG